MGISYTACVKPLPLERVVSKPQEKCRNEQEVKSYLVVVWTIKILPNRGKKIVNIAY